jgi:glycosyltransferase involved in cell wall biosynthesis
MTTIRDQTKLLADCAAVTVVSPSWGLALEHQFGLGSKLHIVTNGYDPEELADVKPHNFGHFAIVYTGTFYPPKRVLSPVMAALKQLNSITSTMNNEWYFHYYGTKNDYVRAEAERFGVRERTILHGVVPRTEALSAVRGAGVAIVVTSITQKPTLADQGMITGKIFEAIGMETPILLVAPLGSDTVTVGETAGLARHFTANDTEGMIAFLMEIMRGRILKPINRDKYAWTSIAKKMNFVLHAAMGNANNKEKKPGEKQQ